MTKLSAEQKIIIQDYIKGIEDKREERLAGRIKFWTGLIGISGLGVLVAVWT